MTLRASGMITTRTKRLCVWFCPLGLVCPAAVMAQSALPVVTGNARVAKLLSEMTLEEKMNLIRGSFENPSTNQGQAGCLPGVPRLIGLSLEPNTTRNRS